ncbi:hypothetical protein Pelo_14765 [Pelomyxa schiedti]|nr:hypothetical protein Pelo_14765 [Pelomyxa schiedti]
MQFANVAPKRRKVELSRPDNDDYNGVTLVPQVVLSAKSQFIAFASALVVSNRTGTSGNDNFIFMPAATMMSWSMMGEFGRGWVVCESRWEGLNVVANDFDEVDEAKSVKNQVFVSLSYTLGVVRIKCVACPSFRTVLGSIGQGRFLTKTASGQTQISITSPWNGTSERSLMWSDFENRVKWGYCNCKWVVVFGHLRMDVWRVINGEPQQEPHTSFPSDTPAKFVSTAVFSKKNWNILVVDCRELSPPHHVWFIDIEKSCVSKSLAIVRDVVLDPAPNRGVLLTDPPFPVCFHPFKNSNYVVNSATGEVHNFQPDDWVEIITDEHLCVSQPVHEENITWNKVTVYSPSSSLTVPCFLLDTTIQVILPNLVNQHTPSGLWAPRIGPLVSRQDGGSSNKTTNRSRQHRLVVGLIDPNSGVLVATLSLQ